MTLFRKPAVGEDGLASPKTIFSVRIQTSFILKGEKVKTLLQPDFGGNVLISSFL